MLQQVVYRPCTATVVVPRAEIELAFCSYHRRSSSLESEWWWTAQKVPSEAVLAHFLSEELLVFAL